MKFKINNEEWSIIETNQEELKKLNNDDDSKYVYGLTKYENQTIYLWKDISREQKRKTLIHELTHCYISTVLFSDKHLNMDIETLCDIASCSHDIIHEIVEWYFRERK